MDTHRDHIENSSYPGPDGDQAPSVLDAGPKSELAGIQSKVQTEIHQNVYFVPRDGIEREVITTDICLYLGNDALVRPTSYTDPVTSQLVLGYHITAHRNLTTAMIRKLKYDSAKWESARRQPYREGAVISCNSSYILVKGEILTSPSW